MLNLEKKKTTLHVVYSEESLRERRERVRGVGSIRQLECIHLVTCKKGLYQGDLQNQKRINFSGTVAGTVLGPAALPGYDTAWQATFRAKKEIFGTARVAVGGPTFVAEDDQESADEASQTQKPLPRTLDGMEPVFYHAPGPDLVEEVLHTLASGEKIAGVVDFTPGDGTLALLCVRRRIPYLGLTFTAKHQEGLMAKLRHGVWKGLKTEGDVLYEPSLVHVLEEAADQRANLEADGDGSAAPAPKAKAKPKARPRGSRTAAAADPASVPEESETDVESDE